MKIKTYFLELQYRFFLFLLHFSFLFLLIYLYKEEITFLILFCQKGEFPYFISTHLTEIFSVYLRLSFFLSLYGSLPFFILQLGLFLNPGLYQYESKFVQNYFCFSLLIYFIGTLLTYKIFIPYCWEFFSSFQTSSTENYVGIHFETKFNSYCNFFLKSLFFLQFSFQLLGFLFFFLPRFQPSFYKISRKLIYFIFLGIATLITPPDVFSQILLATSLCVLYEGFVFFVLLNIEYKRAKNGI